MKSRVVIVPGPDGPVIKELVPTVEWHWHLDWRNLRIGAAFESAMWQFDLPGLAVWCDRYYKHGDVLDEIPEGADVTCHPQIRLSDVQAVGATVHLVSR